MTERVLTVNGYASVPARGQQCCGALHAHAGDLEGARALAKKNIAAFEKSGAKYVVANAAGCGAIMKEYGHLLQDDVEWHERAVAVADVRAAIEGRFVRYRRRCDDARKQQCGKGPCVNLH